MKIPRLFICGILAVAAVCILLPVPCLHAEVKIHPAAGTTSASFLKLGIGSRAVGMAGAFTALSDDVTALYWNPAGLTQLRKDELHFTHNESFESIKHDFAGFARVLRSGVLAAGVYGISMPGDLERRSGLSEDDPFEPLTASEGTFGAHDLAVHCSYARRLNKDLSGGVSLKFIEQSIDDVYAYGAAADLGLLYTSPRLPLSLGLTARHIGTPIKFRDTGYLLPLDVRAGGAWRWSEQLVTTLDLEKPIDNFLFISGGAEYTPAAFLALRAGYRYRWYGQEIDDLSGLSAGLGLNFSVMETDFRFDYAFSPYGVLGNSQRFSISTFFARTRGQKASGPGIHLRKNEAPGREAATEELSEDLTGYTMYPAHAKIRMRSIAGRRTLYALTIACDEGVIYRINGIMRANAPKNVKVRVAEKPGESPVYRHVSFVTSAPLPAAKVSCKLRLLKSAGDIIIVLDDGSRPPLEKIHEDETTSYYQFSMETLSSFRIERK